MLWNHTRAWSDKEDQVLPIGRWENIRVEDGKLLADPVFDEKDPFAQKIAAKVEAGILRMCSVGIRKIATSSEKQYIKPGQTRETVTKWELREASIVDIGSNENAISLYDESDQLIDLSAGSGDEIPVNLLDKPIQKTMDNKALALSLGLKDDATDVEMLSASNSRNTELEQLRQENQQFKDKEKNSRKAEAESLVDAAVKDGRLNADAKAAYLKMFETDHESAKLALAGIPKREKLSTRMDTGSGNRGGEDRSEWNFRDWQKKDSKGLAKMKSENSEQYEELRSSYGK